MAIKLDTTEFLDLGYHIVRNCVPPDQLDAMREHCELMLERQKRLWANDRQPGDSPGCQWASSMQLRVLFDRVVDRENCQVVEFLFHENTYGVSLQILQCHDIVPTQFGMFCNPRCDHGPADWHRGIRPAVHGNVECLYSDFLANPPLEHRPVRRQRLLADSRKPPALKYGSGEPAACPQRAPTGGRRYPHRSEGG